MVVDVDNMDGGLRATNCLVQGGHCHIEMIMGPAGKSVDDRAQGYKLALERAGIAFNEFFVERFDA